MRFEREWDLFLRSQIETARGNRKERLLQDLIGEKKMFREALWPVFQTFEGFILEYPLRSTSGVTIYMDACYEPLRIAFESEGYIAHAENITRDRFAFERMRIRTLALYGYKYIPFSWDELEKRPADCQRAVYELLGRYSYTNESMIHELSVYERELLRYALWLNRPFRNEDAQLCLQLGEVTCRKVLKGLLEKKLIKAAGSGRLKIRWYELDERAMNYILQH